ncbi:MAG TPA: CopG family transcriptional regulator [Caulobacteraceae bacterium]|nr:CopG family transcriptional regulator [Caulobacteraceae bacterium]
MAYVYFHIKLTYMKKTQVYLREEELDALREAASRSGRSVAALVRDAIRQVVLKPRAEGPVAIWDGQPKRSSQDHDSIYDEV